QTFKLARGQGASSLSAARMGLGETMSLQMRGSRAPLVGIQASAKAYIQAEIDSAQGRTVGSMAGLRDVYFQNLVHLVSVAGVNAGLMALALHQVRQSFATTQMDSATTDRINAKFHQLEEIAKTAPSHTVETGPGYIFAREKTGDTITLTDLSEAAQIRLT